MKSMLTVALIMLSICSIVRCEEDRRVLVVVGPSNHPPGSHEVAAGARVMKYGLEQASNLGSMKVDIVEGWPDQALRDAADTIVFIGDTFPANRLPNAEQNLRDLEKMMSRGCGIVCIHYATGLLGEDVAADGGHPLLHWLGGYFANRSCPHHESFAKIFRNVTITPASPKHPISRGWNEFTLDEEPYYNNYFGPDNTMPENVIVLATSMLPPEEPKQEAVAWCVDRTDGGRGFAVVMPHFFENWLDEDLRRLILNGIVWTTGQDVPAGGVQSELPDLETFEPESVSTAIPVSPAK